MKLTHILSQIGVALLFTGCFIADDLYGEKKGLNASLKGEVQMAITSYVKSNINNEV